jgi:putative aldouronate transport system substrate-binding protein
MQNMKKLLASIMVLMLAFSLIITGCGSNTTNTSETSTAENTSAAAAETTPDFSGKYTPEITVTYARAAGLDSKFPAGVSYENNIYTQEYLSELGIKLDTVWTAEGVEAYDTKMNMSIASNNLPDVFKVNAGQLQRLVEADLVEDLTLSVDKYASAQVKELMLADGGEAINQCTFGGKLMAFPSSSVYPGAYEYVFIRDDWRKKLNLPVPQSMEDLLSMAKAFVEQDPDGNGKADTFGLGVSNKPYESYFAMTGFFNGYGAFPNQWVEKDGKLVYGSTLPEMKNALASMKKLYEEKLIDPEFIVKDSYKVSQDAVAGKNGIAYGQFWLQTWPLPDAYKANGADWTAYPIQFSTGVQNKGINASMKLNDMWVVKKGFSNPEALVKMCGLFLDRIFGGKADLAKYKNDGEFGIMGYAPISTFIGEDRNPKHSRVVTEAIDKKDESLIKDLEQKGLYDQIKKFIEGDKDVANWVTYKLSYGKDSVFGIATQYIENKLINANQFYGADTSEMVRRMSILKASEEEMILKIISGDKPIEYFDEFVTNWNKLGGETITFEVNQWRDSLKK